ncbi:hypothetical protein BMA721280_I0451 [Burkholderia mallei 2002721280]|uniref:Uncharacterized protein n=1 Tax=Burkholderia pseudomallei 1710a TaxID=320371 RepID=A0A0E1VUU1_BURPE|nr:hypothetical protein BPC006_II2209 [Burkholderia pseudomallei BPC006]EBA49950.1 hypothetical protein BURPS305_5714 [Burkholderia pseudomallei 305]EDK55796.1 hypothetical protein BMAFMH_E0941 [Burkholderia mallei FMH]EDK61729.1 hypothetical protein BMAJHU_I0863 [Burkholderia mallei JHU]EDK86346.1 hypothetical protein BMA721280_I0451 [Burkholderia mallei 2002721280]EDP87226.1 hypothetical protein BMA10399_B2002 [Burkholderia mallei ATCC 10399]EEC34522.1 hypothetical protein BUC_6492 [Burkhol
MRRAASRRAACWTDTSRPATANRPVPGHEDIGSFEAD